jgi:hypothetical protein
MLSLNDLAAKLKEIDGRGYKAYKDIQGCYRSGDSLLYIDFIQFAEKGDGLWLQPVHICEVEPGHQGALLLYMM